MDKNTPLCSEDMKQLLIFLKDCKNARYETGEYTINLYGRIGKSTIRNWLVYCLGSFVRYTEQDEHKVTLYFDEKQEHWLKICDQYGMSDPDSEKVINIHLQPPQSISPDYLDSICTSEMESMIVKYINE